MRIALFTPLAVSFILTLTAPGVSRRLPPRTAVWLLTVACVVAGGGWAAALGMLAFTLIDRFPDLAAEGGWSTGVLAAHTPIGWPIAALSAVTLVVCTAWLTASAWHRTRLLLLARRHGRLLPPGGELAVLDDSEPSAYALPGTPGRIVVTSGMLRTLNARERGALFAHERTHLRHRHHIFLLVLHLAAAVDPLLRPVATAGALSLERWADEEAAVAVADRSLVARAVARAALATAHRPDHALAATGGPVPQRVRALLAPPPPRRHDLVVAQAALLLACCASLVLSAQDMDKIFDMAGPATGTTASAHHMDR
ncbi:M48 family metalloprotease [Streptomyces sp. 8L]|uniref:M48 family metalloprotease n=1 Tax=Streptomyces sp. 8L TaxID=2877242 RepID=UPI001CD40F0C|nr:M48 family metalloprotease [Streptomyces sp. 8L]MCA1219864.1 M48 family metalloprotease [Streptomyces sp. 8L]